MNMWQDKKDETHLSPAVHEESFLRSLATWLKGVELGVDWFVWWAVSKKFGCFFMLMNMWQDEKD